MGPARHCPSLRAVMSFTAATSGGSAPLFACAEGNLLPQGHHLRRSLGQSSQTTPILAPSWTSRLLATRAGPAGLSRGAILWLLTLHVPSKPFASASTKDVDKKGLTEAMPPPHSPYTTRPGMNPCNGSAAGGEEGHDTFRTRLIHIMVLGTFVAAGSNVLPYIGAKSFRPQCLRQ